MFSSNFFISSIPIVFKSWFLSASSQTSKSSRSYKPIFSLVLLVVALWIAFSCFLVQSLLWSLLLILVVLSSIRCLSYPESIICLSTTSQIRFLLNVMNLLINSALLWVVTLTGKKNVNHCFIKRMFILFLVF